MYMSIYFSFTSFIYLVSGVCLCVFLSGRPVFSGVESEVGAGGGEEQSSNRGSADIGN